jgi:hypothetical protein
MTLKQLSTGLKARPWSRKEGESEVNVEIFYNLYVNLVSSYSLLRYIDET